MHLLDTLGHFKPCSDIMFVTPETTLNHNTVFRVTSKPKLIYGWIQNLMIYQHCAEAKLKD